MSAILLGLFVFPGALGAVAGAETESARTPGNSALGWMNVRDSGGVNLSAYLFATDDGSVLDLGSSGLALVLRLEFAGWLVIVTTGVWLIGYILSFHWLDLFAVPLRATARAFSDQLALPIVLVTAATVGAFFVAWFVLRGLHAKAVLQVATMLAVAVLGPMFLADPLAEVLSAHGWLAQGRDLGISIAAGLTGENGAQPVQLVATMQEELADGFARRPLQVWNFGHVIDDRPACRAAWSMGVAAGDEERVTAGMRECGDAAAYAAASNPGVGQIGAGLLVLVAGTLLLAFAVVLAVRIVRSALDSVYYGLATVFGFAAGGFVYGPTQTFLIRSVVHGFFAAARMAAEIVFLGVYVLFLSDLLRQAHGQVMAVFVIGAIVEVVAIVQLRRLGASLARGNDWVANRFALAVQGGGRGSSATGMGAAAARSNGMGVLAALGAVSAFGNSPVTEWLWGRTRTPLRPFSRTERTAQLAQWGAWGSPGLGGANGYYTQSYLNRKVFSEAARTGAHGFGGLDTVTGAAAAIQHAIDVGAGPGDLYGALWGAGFTDEGVMNRALSSWGIVTGNADDFVLSDQRLGHAVAAMQRVQNTSNRLVRSGSGFKPGKADEVAADLATLQAAAYRFRRANEGGVTLDGGRPGGPQHTYVEAYMSAPANERLSALGKLANGEPLGELVELDPATGRWADRTGGEEARSVAGLLNSGVDQAGAQRMWAWIGNEHAKRIYSSVTDLVANPADVALMRKARSELAAAQDTDRWTPADMAGPWQKLAPPANNPTPANWAREMSRVARRLR